MMNLDKRDWKFILSIVATVVFLIIGKVFLGIG